jgi:predicted transcriptional regulator of viral defense system
MDRFFYENPVFRLSEFSAWKLKNGFSIHPHSIRNALQYYLKRGRIIRIKQELYAVVPPNMHPDTMSVDPYLIAGKLTDDSVIGFHSALELHGVAYTHFDHFYFMTKRKAQPFEYKGQLFQSSSFLMANQNTENSQAEVQVMNRQGVNIRVTSLERTFVDVLSRIELGGGWEEVSRSLENMASLNIDRVIDYCLSIGVSSLSAKVGYFLEKREGALAVSVSQLEKLLKHRPHQSQYVGCKPGDPVKFIGKWNMILPESLVKNSFKDPDYEI